MLSLKTATVLSSVLSVVSLTLLIIVLPLFVHKVQRTNSLLLAQVQQCSHDSTDIWRQLGQTGGHNIQKREYRAPPGAVPRPSGKCCSCQQGAAGAPGPSGKPGEDGSPGIIGTNGRNGRPGTYVSAPTNNEPACQKCPSAPQGPPGHPGVKGNRGSSGQPGTNGIAGNPGRHGPPGPQGVRGVPGERGIQGPPGDAGRVLNGAPPGPSGKAGSIGPRGKPGVSGIDGRPGTEGPKGSRGSQGPRGPDGEMGVGGPPGPPGNPGVKGSCSHCPGVDDRKIGGPAPSHEQDSHQESANEYERGGQHEVDSSTNSQEDEYSALAPTSRNDYHEPTHSYRTLASAPSPARPPTPSYAQPAAPVYRAKSAEYNYQNQQQTPINTENGAYGNEAPPIRAGPDYGGYNSEKINMNNQGRGYQGRRQPAPVSEYQGYSANPMPKGWQDVYVGPYDASRYRNAAAPPASANHYLN